MTTSQNSVVPKFGGEGVEGRKWLKLSFLSQLIDNPSLNIISKSQSLTTILHLKKRVIFHDLVPVKQLLLQSLIADLPLPFLAVALPKRMSF